MRTFTTHKARIALVVAFAAILAQPALKAQTARNGVVANIPFAFQIGTDRLPAGRYTLETEGKILLWIKGDSNSAAMMVLRDSTKRPSADSAVVFHHYGNQYFLREVRTAGDEEFLCSRETKAERRAKLEEDASNPNSGPRKDAKVEVALLTPPR
ncbi:MAG TPA: hypothetical protein VIJ65_04325 [Acidobacteriaceae bacterium]